LQTPLCPDELPLAPMPELKNTKENGAPLLLLFLVAVAASWPLWMYSMKFDILDQYLPWRMLVGDCLSHGMLPLWNPFTHLGYPLHADPQSGAWYPIVWLIGGMAGYNLYWIHLEYLFHVWLAGAGMFWLVKNFTRNKNVAILAGISYMLSGFFTGNAQHLTWVISGAWLPFVLCAFYLLMKKEENKYIWICALTFFMMFTGGYPAFSIVTVYLLIVISIVVIIRRKTQSRPVSLIIKNLFWLGITTALLCAVMLVSSYESFQLAGRAEGLSKELAMANPFSPQSMISFVFPLSSLRNTSFFDTDVSMSNGFLGLLLFAGFILSIFKKKTFTEKIILYGSVFCLLAAMGKYTPVRSLLYDFIPLMKLFRMPSLFRLFAITGFILLGSSTLHQMIVSEKKKQLNSVLIAFSILALISIVVAFVNGPFILPASFTAIGEVNFPTSFILQGMIILISCIIFLLLLKKQFPIYLFSIDLILSAWMVAPITMVNNLNTGTVNQYLTNLPDDFPLPSMLPLQNFKDRTNTFGPFWCNLGILRSQPIYDGYNNFQTRQYLDYEASPLFHHVLKNPIVYLTSTNKTNNSGTATDTSQITGDSTFLMITNLPSLKNSSEAFSGKVSLTQFRPLHIGVETATSAPALLTLQQQFMPGWNVTVDGVPQSLLRSNGFNISVLIPEGKHEIAFHYTDKKVQMALIISALSLLTVLLLLYRVGKTNPDPSLSL
jgi:Bacterial membrane protein YfhO